jgi:gp16 family phage-associated protein
MSADQIKQSFLSKGITFTDWAKENNYPKHEVYRVLNGQNKARFGRGHEIAVKLGLKKAVAA